MIITNNSLERAITGLEQGNVWITGGLGVQQKSCRPIRWVQNWANRVTSLCGRSFFPDIDVDRVNNALMRANWAGVDPRTAEWFFELFRGATGNRIPEERTGIVKKKIAEDTFLQQWSQKVDVPRFFRDVLGCRVRIRVREEDFVVIGDRDHVRVENSTKDMAAASIIYEEGAVKAFMIMSSNPSPDTLEEVLLGAHRVIRAQHR